MPILPTSDQQIWIIDCAADLISKQGSEAFLSLPPLEPGSTLWKQTIPLGSSLLSIRQSLRLLLDHVGLGDVPMIARGGSFENPKLTPTDISLSSLSGVYFSGLKKSKKRGTEALGFNIDLSRSEHAQDLFAVLCTEVTRAYRCLYGLTYKHSPDAESKLIDLNCAYLGFGLLNANARQELIEGSLQNIEVFGLSPLELVFALVTRVCARRRSRWSRFRLSRHLTPNLRTPYQDAVEYLLLPESQLQVRLGIEAMPFGPGIDF